MKKPPRSSPNKNQLFDEAMLLLEIDAQAVLDSPRIEHLFKGIGGQRQVFEYLSGSEEPEARKLIELRGRLNQKQADAIPFEAYCVAAGISVKKMFGIIAAETADQSAKATMLLSKSRHPEVLQATIDNALTPFGDKDRKMLHQAEGYVPVPKTSVTHFHAHVDQRTTAQAATALPPPEDSIKALSARFATIEVPALAAPVEVDDEREDDD